MPTRFRFDFAIQAEQLQKEFRVNVKKQILTKINIFMFFGKKKNFVMLSIRRVFHYMLFNLIGELGKKLR